MSDRGDFRLERHLSECRALAVSRPGKSRFRHDLATALMVAVAKASSPGLRYACLTELRDLALDHVDEPYLRSRFAEGIVNLTSVAADTEGFEEPLRELRILAARYPSESTFRVRLAMALANLVQVGGIVDGETFLDELRELARCLPGNEEICLQLARALDDLLLACIEAERPVLAGQFWQELARLFSASTTTRGWSDIAHRLFAFTTYLQLEGVVIFPDLKSA